MEDLDTIEENFNKKIEILDKEFINDLKNSSGQNVNLLETQYRKKLAEELVKYESKFNEFLNLNKKTVDDYKDANRILPKKEKEEEEDSLDFDKPYTSTHLDMSYSREDLSRMKKDINSFKRNLKYKKLFRTYVPGFVIINYFRLKILWKSFKLEFSNFIFRIESQTRREFLELVDLVKNFLKKAFHFLSGVIPFFVNWFKVKIMRKKEVSEEGKSEDAKIAEKLLKKDKKSD